MILCDRCHIPLEQPINKNKFFLNDYVEGRGSYSGFYREEEIYLCLTCQKKVIDFIKGRKEANDGND